MANKHSNFPGFLSYDLTPQRFFCTQANSGSLFSKGKQPLCHDSASDPGSSKKIGSFSNF